jgi:glycosyltransferase involved in cell wall biosynthesis
VRDPAFSIVMPAYEAAATIEPAIRSALLQSVGDLEILVVDDGSSDDTRARAEALARDDARVRVFSQPNAGPSAARNRALAEARGSLIAFLDADDLLFPEYVERMQSALQSAPDAGLAYTDAWVIDHATGRIRSTSAMMNQNPPTRPLANATAFLRELLRRNFIFISATVRREALDRAGGWRESLTAAEDYEQWLRIVAHGYAAVPVAGRLALHRELAGSNSDDLPRQLRSMREVYRLVAEEWEVDNVTRQLARERQRQLDALSRRFDPERRDLRETFLRPARALRQTVRDRSLWLSEAPPAVAQLLQATSAPART